MACAAICSLISAIFISLEMRGQNKRIAQVQMQVLRLMSCAVPDDWKEVPTLWCTGQNREPSDSLSLVKGQHGAELTFSRANTCRTSEVEEKYSDEESKELQKLVVPARCFALH
ncbi:uncharacterized protein [Triticum aestivum]|uniref:uncharacterized protein isoform X2 n=1 Tax=Triticum aestivum TaxID=4565 RepID=UPI001D018253|nr:uncharacterized protein LOC123143768 isoform X2 [Triticum aestivum]